MLDQVTVPAASFMADGACDQDGLYAAGAARHPEATVVVPPRPGAVPGDTAGTVPSQRDRHLRAIAGHGRRAWQVTSGYRWRALVKADTSRLKRVIGGSLRSRTDRRRATEAGIAVGALNRMPEPGHPTCVRVAWERKARGPRGGTP